MSEREWVRAFEGRMRLMGMEFLPETPQKLARYHALLYDWNARMNLTGSADFDDALDRHYMDSLAPLTMDGLFPRGRSLIDVGTGAGFPGLPIAIARPDLTVTLLDSLQKRLNFLAAVAEELGLANVRLCHARAEEAGQSPEHRERYDIAVARAVAPLPVLCELLLPFVRVGGRALCYKGPAAAEEWNAGEAAARALGGGAPERFAVSLPARPEWAHCVVAIPKAQKTVRQYPRKPGTPARKPLGGFDEKAPGKE